MLIKHHIKILLIGLILTVLYAGFELYTLSCEGEILIGSCGIGKILLIRYFAIFFVSWAIITSIIQWIVWIRTRSVLKIRWYALTVILMVIFQSAYNIFLAPTVYQIQEKKRFNSSNCKIRDGRNTYVNGTTRTEVDCKKGNIQGEYLTFDSDQLVSKQHYDDGEPVGDETYYNTDGSTKIYIVHDPDKVVMINGFENQNGNQVYYQIPEEAFRIRIDNSVDSNSQQYTCSHVAEVSANTHFTCINGKFDGMYEEIDQTTGQVRERFNLVDGVLDGPAIIYNDESGEIEEYAEYKNGVLHGRIYSVTEGKKEYEGQYENGLQEGVFTMYDTDGAVQSKVRFNMGEVVEVIEFKDPFDF